MSIVQCKERVVLWVGDGGGVRERAAQVARASAGPARDRDATDRAAAFVGEDHADHCDGALGDVVYGAAAPSLLREYFVKSVFSNY